MTADWVRVRDDRTGHIYTCHRLEADATKDLRILPQAAADPNGRPLPPHHDIRGTANTPAADPQPARPAISPVKES